MEEPVNIYEIDTILFFTYLSLLRLLVYDLIQMCIEGRLCHYIFYIMLKLEDEISFFLFISYSTQPLMTMALLEHVST